MTDSRHMKSVHYHLPGKCKSRKENKMSHADDNGLYEKDDNQSW